MKKVTICALYKFVELSDYTSLRRPILDTMLELGIRGTLLLAREGINGTVAGDEASIHALLAFLQSDKRLSELDYKCSHEESNPFYRTKVRLKREIVTMGVEGIDPLKSAGTYVEPEEWNALIRDPDTILIDTRNNYEVSIGTFKNAQNPETDSFREFPDYVQNHLDPARHRKVAMFCTGGIRCEKSTAYLKEQGFDEVYHLKGGILKYLEKVPEEESLWEGECFVFDNRVAVNHTLEKGQYDMCHACRMPITEQDRQDPRFEKGVSCLHCYDKTSDERKKRFKDREHQIQMVGGCVERHIGPAATTQAKKNRATKLEKREEQNPSDSP